MIDFELDEEGYPTWVDLEKISNWDGDKKELLDSIGEIWAYKSGFWDMEEVEILDKKKLHYHISTAGWSGNEDIVESLRSNTMFWLTSWVQSRRGGHYIFEVEND